MVSQREFIDFLVSLAPQGETPLVVTQRPRKDKPEQYTYAAALPSARVREGAAVFGNTASFVLDRMTEGKPSASLANAGRVLVMVLDDIGTTSKTPQHIHPTWVMETSPGNFQWGFAFAVQPEPGEFAAAIKAIAAAGYTDPGAINAARNFRLPGSVNLKPGKDGFVSRLVEFHPERRFLLNAILKALGVTPDEASATVKPLQLGDTGEQSDEVLAWLAEHGMVLGRANAEGWVGVVCPNHAEHTDGKQEGRYHPSDRGYKCLHAHCQHITSEAFLEWVGENGGPAVAVGVRAELLSERLAQSLNKLKPQPNPIVEASEAQERQRLEKAEWFTRYAYLESDDAYFDLMYRKVVTRSAFNALYAHVVTKNIKTDAHCDAATWYNQNRVAMGGKSLVALTYAAGDGALVSHNGEVKGNLWVDARPDVSATHSQVDVSMWLDLCRTLVPEPEALEHIWNVMAFKVQNPRRKINHAILHMGDEGTGKDTMWAPFLWSVCGPDHRNRAIVNGGELSAQWGYAYESEILVLNELHEPEASQRRALANKLKPLIAAPPETISINRKMMRPYDAANRLFVLAFSNEAVPISISSQDRRWFVIRSQAARLPEPQAVALWGFYKAGGFEAIARWLYARDVSKFNPAAIPASTEAKEMMVSNGLSSAEDYLVGLIEKRSGEFARGVVSSRWSVLLDRLQGAAPSSIKLYRGALFHALKEAKWIDRGRVHSSEFPTKVDVWCAPELKDMSKSDLRRLVEPTQVAGVVTPFRKGPA